jgi:DNA-binding Lrp family transcriptional regulator
VSVSAYILIETEMGKAGEVARSIRGLGGVTSADDVTGPYDIIVHAEADDLDGLGRAVLSQIQTIPGITRTVTCPVVHL